jgi:hypothetical protein
MKASGNSVQNISSSPLLLKNANINVSLWFCMGVNVSLLL